MLALGLPLSGAFVATAPAGSSSACARYRSVLDVVVHMNMEATRDGDPTMSASRLTGGTSRFAAQHTNTVLDMGLMVDPIARNCLDRNAKIVSTLGPASFSQEMIEKLVAAGALCRPCSQMPMPPHTPYRRCANPKPSPNPNANPNPNPNPSQASTSSGSTRRTGGRASLRS